MTIATQKTKTREASTMPEPQATTTRIDVPIEVWFFAPDSSSADVLDAQFKANRFVTAIDPPTANETEWCLTAVKPFPVQALADVPGLVGEIHEMMGELASSVGATLGGVESGWMAPNPEENEAITAAIQALTC